jgi:hypothetical protein
MNICPALLPHVTNEIYWREKLMPSVVVATTVPSRANVTQPELGLQEIESQYCVLALREYGFEATRTVFVEFWRTLMTPRLSRVMLTPSGAGLPVQVGGDALSWKIRDSD